MCPWEESVGGSGGVLGQSAVSADVGWGWDVAGLKGVGAGDFPFLHRRIRHLRCCEALVGFGPSGPQFLLCAPYTPALNPRPSRGYLEASWSDQRTHRPATVTMSMASRHLFTMKADNAPATPVPLCPTHGGLTVVREVLLLSQCCPLCTRTKLSKNSKATSPPMACSDDERQPIKSCPAVVLFSAKEDKIGTAAILQSCRQLQCHVGTSTQCELAQICTIVRWPCNSRWHPVGGRSGRRLRRVPPAFHTHRRLFL